MDYLVLYLVLVFIAYVEWCGHSTTMMTVVGDACPTESQLSLRESSRCTIITCITARFQTTPASSQEDWGAKLSDSYITRDMMSINVLISSVAYDHQLLAQSIMI